jgi:hypothetical protein
MIMQSVYSAFVMPDMKKITINVPGWEKRRPPPLDKVDCGNTTIVFINHPHTPLHGMPVELSITPQSTASGIWDEEMTDTEVIDSDTEATNESTEATNESSDATNEDPEVVQKELEKRMAEIAQLIDKFNEMNEFKVRRKCLILTQEQLEQLRGPYQKCQGQ